MTVSILGVVLAGGQAKRMKGQAKGLVPFKERALMSYALEALSSVCDRVMVNANVEIPSYEALGYSVFSDVVPYLDKGPLSGIYAALLHAQEGGFSHLMLSPCDTPYVDKTVFLLLKHHAELELDRLFFMESVSGVQPLHTIMPVIGALVKLGVFLQNENKVMHFYRGLRAQSIRWEDEQTFININYLKQLTDGT